ncbi:MAG: nucleotidyltransferase family protein [Candidatus Riflebacteria bacterium]|nr:nucleotidyltransferase family protein [Candidatus Riflebacteria bacterium]
MKKHISGKNIFSEADKLLTLLALAAPSDAEKSEIRRLFDCGVDFSEFTWKLRHNDIAPMIFLHLDKLNLLGSVPDVLLHELRDRHREITEKNTGRLAYAEDIFKQFQKAGIEVIVLKGVLFAETIYKDVGYKKMNDMDILIRHRDVKKVKEVYRNIGLVPLALFESGDEKESETKSYHLPSYISRDLNFVIGTHWNLCSPKAGYKINREILWDRSVETFIRGTKIRSLCASDALLHLVVHFHYYKTGLKEFADFVNLIRSVPHFPWDEFSSQVEKAETFTPAYRTLSILNALFPGIAPDSLVAKCREKADKWVVRDTDRLVRRKDLLLKSRSVYNSRIEKAYLGFSFENRFLKKFSLFLVFWKRLLFPPAETLYRTNSSACCENSLFWLWTMNVYRTAREVGQSHGMGIFLLLMLKSSWELIHSAFWNITGNISDPMEELRRELGTDEKRLRELMESME